MTPTWRVARSRVTRRHGQHIYDRYADRLHDYCWSILRDHHEAEDALQDAFVTAAARIDQLRDPARLRPWLYAVCRTSALGRARRRAKVVPTEDVGAMTAAPDTSALDAPDEGDLRQIVWDAAGGLAPRDRAVLELHLRHELVGQDLAEALGVSPHHATVLLGRVRDLVERSLGALLVGRTGRRDSRTWTRCSAGWDGSLSPLLRKRVARHIDGCEVCGERRRTMVSPLALLSTMPLVPAPGSLRARVLAEIERTPPGQRVGRPSPWPPGSRRRVRRRGPGRRGAAAGEPRRRRHHHRRSPVDDDLVLDDHHRRPPTSTTEAPTVTAQVTPGGTEPPLGVAGPAIAVLSGPVDFGLRRHRGEWCGSGTTAARR